MPQSKISRQALISNYTADNKGIKRKSVDLDVRVARPASARANAVSGKRKRTEHLDSWNADISTLPELDANILQQVRDLGQYPRGFWHPQTQDEKDQLNLRWCIRKHRRNFHTDTLAELDAWQRVSANSNAVILQRVRDLGHYLQHFKHP